MKHAFRGSSSLFDLDNHARTHLKKVGFSVVDLVVVSPLDLLHLDCYI